MNTQQASEEGKSESKPSPSLTPDNWKNKWTAGTTGWHEQTGNELLWKHFSRLMGEHFLTRNAADLTIFVPLCGKATDMYKFYEMGFTVVGIEFAPQPIKEFFEENEISTAPADDTPYTKSSDGRIILGQGDLYSFTGNSDVKPGGRKLPFSKYDVIWDRGSFEAINMEDREKYSAHMSELLADDGLYLLSADDYDFSEYQGPPFKTNMANVQKYFGAMMSIELVDSDDRLKAESPSREHWISTGLTWMIGYLYKMKKEQGNT